MKKKKIILLIIILSATLSSHSYSADKARGIFLALGVGPRVPVFSFSNSSFLGYGLNVEVSYADNESLPIFIFGKIGFEQYPGKQDYYQKTDYSNYSLTLIPINLGIRYYFPPLFDSAIPVLPTLETSVSMSLYNETNEFKIGSGKSNFTDTGTKFGFSAGVGASMFIIEVLASYNYYNKNQFLSFDLKIRIPLGVTY
ncbi:MAG: hypothetical protein STSR0008_25420 [Ignavibacterium sp.]